MTREEAVELAREFVKLSIKDNSPTTFEVVQIGKANPKFKAQLFGQHVFRKNQKVTDIVGPGGIVR